MVVVDAQYAEAAASDVSCILPADFTKDIICAVAPDHDLSGG